MLNEKNYNNYENQEMNFSENSENELAFEYPNELYPNVETVGYLAEDWEEKSLYSEDEGIDDYKEGGYHPVFVGEILNGRYVILQKLGWGHFSTVWLCRDTKFGSYVAIKV